MTEVLNRARICRDQDTALFGIEATRKVLRVADIRCTQLMLRNQFGGAIEPLDDIPDLEILSPAESSTALIRAGIRPLGHTGMVHVLHAMQDIPTDIRVELTSKADALHVIEDAENGNSTISLSFATDLRHARHHDLLTGMITAASHSPYQWTDFAASLPIAKLANPSLAGDIESHYIDLSVLFGSLFVRRPDTGIE